MPPNRQRIRTSSSGWLLSLAAWRATAEERANALPPLRRARVARELQRNGARRELLALYGLVTGTELAPARGVTEAAMVAAIEAALSAGRLLLIPSASLGGGSAPNGDDLEGRANDERRTVKAVMGDRADLEYERGRYRFVASVDWSGRSRGYRVLPRLEALALVALMAPRIAKTPAEQAAWQALAEKLTDSNGGVGILLVRYLPPAATPPARSKAPAVTPSQARQQEAETAWIEIRIVYDDGTPYDGSCAVVLPDGKKTEGPPDADGAVRITGIAPGSCQLSFPSLDASAWAPG